jgi:hypothetical protein
MEYLVSAHEWALHRRRRHRRPGPRQRPRRCPQTPGWDTPGTHCPTLGPFPCSASTRPSAFNTSNAWRIVVRVTP